MRNRTAKLEQLLAIDTADGLDDHERATLDAALTPEQARVLADRLYDLRACDPAVGSGAFPVALLHELVNLARLAETRARGKDPAVTDPRWLFDTKTRFIERCLYGVDLQDRAIEICKLRLWLSLVVDYPLDVDVDASERRSFRNALKRLPALPNLDFKIRRANSLVDTIRGEPVPLGRLHAGRDARLVLNQLAAAKRDFYSADSVPEKRRLRFAIYEATAELAQIELTVARNELGLIPDPANAEKVAELDHAQKEMGAVLAKIHAARKLKAADQDDTLERLRVRFDDPAKPTFVWQLDFAEVFHRDDDDDVRLRAAKAGTLPLSDAAESDPREPEPSATDARGFDLLVGNPPYVRIQVLKQAAPEQVAWFKTHYEAAKKGNYDLYVVFVERGLQLLAPYGQLAFILPHKFFNAQYGQPLRELLAKGKHVRHVVHFGDQQVFPGATNYVCLLFLAKSGTDTCRWARVKDLAEWLAIQQAPETILPTGRFGPAEWNFVVGPASGLFDKLQAMPVKLGNVADIFVGLQTSADKIYVLEGLAKPTSGLVKVRDREGNQWEIERDILKPFLCDVSLTPYIEPTSGHWLVFPYRTADGKAELVSPKEFTKTFPNAWRYLKNYEEQLRKRESGKADGPAWFGYIYRKNLVLFDVPKLIVQVISQSARFAFDGNSLYFTGGGNGPYYGLRWRSSGEPRSLHYLQALLNSRLLDFYLHSISTTFRGGYFSYGKQFIAQLPIRPIDFGSAAERAEHDALVALVERILVAKRSDPTADTSAWEREIDDRVYRLYGLTQDEIQLAEESVKR